MSVGENLSYLQNLLLSTDCHEGWKVSSDCLSISVSFSVSFPCFAREVFPIPIDLFETRELDVKFRTCSSRTPFIPPFLYALYSIGICMAVCLPCLELLLQTENKGKILVYHCGIFGGSTGNSFRNVSPDIERKSISFLPLAGWLFFHLLLGKRHQ